MLQWNGKDLTSEDVYFMSESFSRAARSAREMARMLLRWLVLALPIGLHNLWMVAQAIRNQSVLEIEYQKLKDCQIVKRTVEPVGLMFSEYYFYLMGIITDSSTRETFHKKNDPYPTIYRLDRIHSIKETGEKFSIPYKERFKEGEYKNRTQFMFGGEPQTIRFNYYGPSVEAVLDKFPMAKVVDEKEGVCSIEAEVFGTGVKMWLLSQGSKVKVTAPETLVQEMRAEVQKMQEVADKA